VTSASLSTPRLRLRPPRSEDAPAIFAAYGADAEVSRFLTWRTHRNAGDAHAFVAAALAGWRDGSSTPYLAWQDSGLVGATGLESAGAGWLRLGYLVRRDRWGQGLAGEMVEAMVKEAWRRGADVEALVEPGHQRSVRVLEKAGFRREGEGRAVHPNLGPGERRVLRFVRRQD
jgi:[ribosomal protein S5]-alanine N-acetyltransferase